MHSPPDASPEIRRIDSFAPESLRLVDALRSELGALYPEKNPRSFPPNDITDERAVFVIASLGGKAVGCGALRPLPEGDPRVAEIRRMFVEPAARRGGVGRAILRKLEELARAGGYHTARLETGLRQLGAIRLYESAGYRRIECYGRYANEPLSICFEKSLFLAAESDL